MERTSGRPTVMPEKAKERSSGVIKVRKVDMTYNIFLLLFHFSIRNSVTVHNVLVA